MHKEMSKRVKCSRHTCVSTEPSRPWTVLQTVVLLWFLLATTACTDIKRWMYEGFDRDAWQYPEEVIQNLKIQPGEQVADIGAGSGYFTFRLADAVGPKGKIYAVDIDEDMNAMLAERVQKQGYKNIEIILAKAEDPELPEKSIDLIFSSNAYHHLDDPSAYFFNLRKYLKPDARIAIIDFKGEGIFQTLSGHYTPSETIQQDLEEAGFILLEEHPFLSKQVFLVFAMDRS